MKFHAVSKRLQSIERVPAALASFPLQTAAAFSCSPLVQFLNHALEGLLQARLIVNLKDYLPRRRWQDGSVNCESELSAQWRCEVLAHLQTVIGFKFTK